MANYVSLNGVELTDQGRTITEGIDRRQVEGELASGSKVRYTKANKKTWTIDWEWLPNATSATYDSKGARDSLKTIVYAAINSVPFVQHTLVGNESFTVLIGDYKEDLLRRDIRANVSFWKVSLTLVEV